MGRAPIATKVCKTFAFHALALIDGYDQQHAGLTQLRRLIDAGQAETQPLRCQSNKYKNQNFDDKVDFWRLKAKKMNFIFASADDIGQELARRLKIARLALGLTQAELATRTGVSVGTIRNLERSGDCAFVTVIKLAQVLRLEGGFAELFKPGIQSISELAQLERANFKRRQRAPRKPRPKQEA